MAVLSIQYFHHLFVYSVDLYSCEKYYTLFDVFENLKESSRIDWSFFDTDVAEFDLISVRCSEKIEDPVHGIEQHEADWENNSRIFIYHVHILDLGH